MRPIRLSSFISLDGVIQGPGGPTEDPTGGFTLSGWLPPLFDEMTGQFVDEAMGEGFDLLLGRKTYEIFAAHWPYTGDEMGRVLTSADKFVAAGPDTPLTWANSHRLEGDVVEAVGAVKAQGERPLLIQGSGRLIQTLLKADLVDEITTLTFPVVLGRGKRLFEPTGHARTWTLLESRHSPAGAVVSRYARAGEVQTGSFLAMEPSALEEARQERMRREG